MNSDDLREQARLLRDKGGECLELAAEGTSYQYIQAMTAMACHYRRMADWVESRYVYPYNDMIEVIATTPIDELRSE